MTSITASYAVPYAFNGAVKDLDLSGTPVLFTPIGCPPVVAIAGKAGQLNFYNSSAIGAGPIGNFTFSEMNGDISYVGNGAYSPLTGLFYADVPTSQGGSLEPPGMAAFGLTNCNAPNIVWDTLFGSDSYNIGSHNGQPRSAPTVTAGNVVFVASPTAAGTSQVWALDAKAGTVLNGGLPVFTTGNLVRMPPVIDGRWLYVLDQGGNLYGYTIDPTVPAIRAKFRQTSVHEGRW